MRRRLQHMLETWNDAGMLLRLSLVTGEDVVGRLEELDGDEVILEPVDDDGVTGPLTVVLLNHVVAATYVEVSVPAGDESS